MKLYDADDGDRWRKAKHDLQEKCCGEVDSVGTCMAPACRQGEALRAMHEMLEHIDFSDAERKRLEAVPAQHAELVAYLNACIKTREYSQTVVIGTGTAMKIADALSAQVPADQSPHCEAHWVASTSGPGETTHWCPLCGGATSEGHCYRGLLERNRT